MEDLGQMTLFYGSEELLYPDCCLLEKELARARGTELKSILGQGWGHDWVIFPLRESQKALLNMVDFIKITAQEE